MKFKKIMFVIFLSMVYCYSFDLSQLTEYYDNDKIPHTIKDFAPRTSNGCLIDSNLTFDYFVNNPDSITTNGKFALLSAVWFWNSNNLYKCSDNDNGSMERVTIQEEHKGGD